MGSAIFGPSLGPLTLWAAAAWGTRALPRVVAVVILKGFSLTSFQYVETSLTLAFANFRGLCRQQAVALSPEHLLDLRCVTLWILLLWSSYAFHRHTEDKSHIHVVAWSASQIVPGVEPHHNR